MNELVRNEVIKRQQSGYYSDSFSHPKIITFDEVDVKNALKNKIQPASEVEETTEIEIIDADEIPEKKELIETIESWHDVSPFIEMLEDILDTLTVPEFAYLAIHPENLRMNIPEWVSEIPDTTDADLLET